jgi:hypothetical protein
MGRSRLVCFHWSIAAFAVLGVAISAGPVCAQQQPEPPALPGWQELEKMLPPGAFDPEQWKQLRKVFEQQQDEMRKMMEDLRKQLPGGARLKLPEMPRVAAGPLPFKPAFNGPGSLNLAISRGPDGSFTASQDADGVVITINGTVDKNKADISGIEIQEGGKANNYKALADVPENHRESVQGLIDRVEGMGALGKGKIGKR